jgi:hypothetical protein
MCAISSGFFFGFRCTFLRTLENRAEVLNWSQLGNIMICTGVITIKACPNVFFRVSDCETWKCRVKSCCPQSSVGHVIAVTRKKYSKHLGSPPHDSGPSGVGPWKDSGGVHDVLAISYPSVDVNKSKSRLCQQTGSDEQIQV